MAFDDLILESVQSVTKAATSLISAATAAQKVLVAQGKMSGSGKKVKCPFSLSISLSILHTTGQGGQPMVPGLSFCGYSCCLCHRLPVRGCQHCNTGGKLRLKTLNDGRPVEGGDGRECSGCDCKTSLQVNNPACLGLPGTFLPGQKNLCYTGFPRNQG